MTTYTFNVLPDTSANYYFDIQYFDSNLYCTSSVSPYIIKLSPSGVITPICTDADASFNGQKGCLAIYGSTTIYYSNNINNKVYTVDVSTGIASEIATVPGSQVRTITLNTAKTHLYAGTSTEVYIMNTTPPFTPNLFASGYNNLSTVRYFNHNLYVNDYADRNLVILDNSGNTLHTYNTGSTSTSGTVFDIYEDWYVANNNSGSEFSLVNKDDGTLTDISTNGIPYNGADFKVIAFDENDFAYQLTWNNVKGIYKSTSAFCFNEGTKILCMNNQLADEYIAIELLQIGDFVKTYKHGYRRVSKVIKGSFRNNPKKWNMCMYKMAKTDTNGLIEDLIVTGGHSILVDAISEEEQKRYDAMKIPDFSKLTIDNKHLLLSCCSDQFTPMQDRKIYTYYHLLLENNDDEEERFGIWANGVLTETPNVKTVK